MKKLNYIALGIAGLALLFIFLPWIHRSNSEYYVYGFSLSSGKLGVATIIISSILIIIKKFTAAITVMAIDIFNSFSFLLGWTQRASSDGAKNVFEGLQISLFLYLFSIIVFILIIWEMKLKTPKKKKGIIKKEENN